MRARHWLLVGAGGCVLAIGVLLWRSAPTAILESARGSGRATSPAVGSQVLPEVASGPSRIAVETAIAVVVVVVVVDVDGGSPLSSATLTWLRRDAAPNTLTDQPFASSDASGRIEFAEAANDRVLLCRAPGYVPQTIALPCARDERIALRRSATLQVSVIDELGRGVPDALVVLTHQPLGDLESAAPLGIGHPLASHPRWRARTNARGDACTDEVPPGQYYLNLLCDDLMPLDETAANGALDLAGNLHRMTVSLQEAYGIAFQCPSRSPVKNVTWSIPTERLVAAPRVASRLASLRQRLADRFTEAIVYSHLPLPGPPVKIQCFVVLQDGTFWMGESELVRMSTIEAPVFLEQFQGSMRMITIEVVDPDGKKYDDVPLVLRNRSGGPSVKLRTGVAALVPNGAYKVNPGRLDVSIYQALEGLLISVDERSPTTVTVRLAEALAELIVRVKYPNAEVRCPLLIEINDEDGKGANVANYRPDRGPIHRLVTGNTVTIRVNSVGYEDVEMGPVKLDRTRPNVVDVSLSEKAR